MLTIDINKTSIHSDDFDEVQSLKPKHLVIIEANDTGTRWYQFEEPIRDETGWVIPLSLISQAGEEEARRTGSIRTITVRCDGSLA